MKSNLKVFTLYLLLFCLAAPPVAALAAGEAPAAAKLDDIIAGVEKRYSGSGFMALFDQASTLKEMGITDHATGKVYVRHPGMMRWVYEKPDSQIFVTDSKTLWIYRPEDNQVMVGEAPAYFGSGKGASFLSDMGQLKENFNIRRDQGDTADFYVLSLYPRQEKVDVAVIYLYISKDRYEVMQLVSLNSFGDQTRISFHDLRFNQNLGASLFKFEIPPGTDVLKLDGEATELP